MVTKSKFLFASLPKTQTLICCSQQNLHYIIAVFVYQCYLLAHIMISAQP